MKYLSATINESMRLSPAAPTSQPRVVPSEGAMVAGHWVPGGVSSLEQIIEREGP
jgi:hypothetical protein